MEMKREGPAFPPLPVGAGLAGETGQRAARILHDGGEPRCEMCGYSVLASHCKRICLRCGFMTGCSEGI